MNVPSAAFLGAVALVAAILAPSAAPRWRRGVLFVANVGFFATFAQGVASVVPFIAFLVAGFAGLKAVERRKSRLLFAAVVAALVIGFCWLKRYAFFPGQMLLSQAYVTIGLSYAFFRVVGLVVDAHQGVVPEPVGPMEYVNYALNFTSFVSGPVQLYRPFHRDEVVHPAALGAAAAWTAIERIVMGFFKVTVVSPLLSAVQQKSLELAPAHLRTAGALADAAIVFAIFPIYLYANFSGYTDVVIGAARFLRLELPENFDRPFASRGYLEFWSRWHMSLSNWFKTYVYSPFLLALMRRFPSRAVEPFLGVGAYFVTFFLVGLWHGQTPAFLLLGVLMGGGVSGNKLYQIVMIRRLGRAPYYELCKNPIYAAVSAGLTFVWLSLTLVLFWATPGTLAGLIADFGAGPASAAVVVVLLIAAASYAAARAFESFAPAWRASRAAAAAYFLRPAWYAALAAVVVSVAVVLAAPAPHIVYRAF